ncbi:zinc-binding dehydrogenase [Nonomuraea sp. NPDC050643]|uniref:zinc-binding dehydrogenase n=1 Tax=Nonomuraea sp. NPDC050643 TaxID=3155660 RepID=UPI0033E7C295
MWALRQPGPGVFERIEVPVPDRLADGEVLLRLRAGAICGSDVPKFLGAHDPDNPYTGMVGVPLHEVVGEVAGSNAEGLPPGARVVGIAENSRGLAEYFVTPARLLHRLDSDLDDVSATVVQPLSTVLSTLDRVPAVHGKRVAVLGLGPLGLLFTHVLKSMGAATVIGVDRVDRSGVAQAFGIDELFVGDTRAWSARSGRPDLCVEAIGHRQDVVADAIEALAPHGHLFVFGLPEDHYVIPMRTFFRKHLTMQGGTTLDWTRFLAEAEKYLLDHPGLPEAYITDVFPVDRAEEAYRRYAFPAEGRLKVAITATAPRASW